MDSEFMAWLYLQGYTGSDNSNQYPVGEGDSARLNEIMEEGDRGYVVLIDDSSTWGLVPIRPHKEGEGEAVG